jgi:ribonuclease BN (tRNA processing enzyme)
MKLTLLGTGPFSPDTPHASAGYVLEAGGQTIKIDFGRGNLLKMAAAGIDWRSLDAILISHIHPDHVTDLFQYLQALCMLGKDSKSAPPPIYGPPGFSNFFDQFTKALEAPVEFLPDVHELEQHQMDLGKVGITTAVLNHGVPNIGMRFDYNGKGMCYTGDTAPCEALTQLANGADVLLTECAGETASQSHMSSTDVATLVREAGIPTVVLTHYPGDPIVRTQMVSQVQAQCPKEVTVFGGEDGKIIEI